MCRSVLPMVQLPGADPRPSKQVVRVGGARGKKCRLVLELKAGGGGKDPCQRGGGRKSGLGWGLGFCIANKLPGDPDAAGPGIVLGIAREKRRQGSVRFSLREPSDSLVQVLRSAGGRSPSRAPFLRPINTPACCVTLFKPRIHSGPQFLHLQDGVSFPTYLPFRLLGRFPDLATGAASSTCNMGASGPEGDESGACKGTAGPCGVWRRGSSKYSVGLGLGRLTGSSLSLLERGAGRDQADIQPPGTEAWGAAC